MLYDRLIKEEEGSLLKRYQDWRSDKGLLGESRRRARLGLGLGLGLRSKACGSQPANSQCASTNTRE